jgi:hypothetical protein
MRRVLIVAALVAAVATPRAPLGAQGGTPITAAKRAAGGAAAKANAHVAAVSTPSERPAANGAAPTASQPASAAARAPKGKAAARPDTTVKVPVTKGASTSVAQRGAAGELTFSREIFSYAAGGRRDPFLSLLKSGDLRPLLSDLKLVTVLYDPTGRNSVAILRDLSTKDQYRVKLGQQLGRMRVAQIQPKQLVFTIEEFGYSRQEVLALVSDTTSARTR